MGYHASAMTTTRDFAARHLVEARRSGKPTSRLPEFCRPWSNADALDIQRRVLRLMKEEIGGWKCSLPNGDRILVAPLPESTIHRSSPCPILPKGTVAEIEPEIAFILKNDLIPRSTHYSEDEVREAVAETRLVLELMASRYADLDAVKWLENPADSAKNQGMFIGPVVADAFEKPIEAFRLSIDSPAGKLFDREVHHPNDHPLKPLHWLANFLSGHGETLHAGKIITTGSYAGIIEVPMETPLTFSFGSLGQFDVEFIPQV